MIAPVRQSPMSGHSVHDRPAANRPAPNRPTPTRSAPGRSVPGQPGPGQPALSSQAAARLSESECWSRLRARRECRLRYLSGRGPRAVVVPYEVAFDGLLVHLPAFNEAAEYVGGREVTMEVDGADASGARWIVEVSGVGSAVSESVVRQAGLDRGIEQWPPGIRADYFQVPATVLAGQQALRTPPAAGT